MFWPFNKEKPTRDNYLEIATLTVDYRNLGLARYIDPKATIAAAVAAANAESNPISAMRALCSVLEMAERKGEVAA